MIRSRLPWMLGAVLSLSQAAIVHAAELQILAGGGIAAPLKELAAQFESATGHKLVIRFGTTPELIKMATTGGSFDVGVVPVDVMKDTAALAKFAPGAQTGIARVGLGVAVRSGAPKPDISTAEALKKTLLSAKSIASIPASATGYLLDRVYARLGITEEMKVRTKPQPTPAQIVESVAKGENELAVFLTNVLTAPGVDVVGPFPPELQLEVVYTGAVAAGAKQADAAKAFLQFITTPAAAAVIKAKGMTPG